MFKRNSKCESGTSLIEFALLAPVFLFLMVGLIEVGRYTYYGIVAVHAARAGVQFGSQNLVTAADPGGNAIENAALADAGSPSGWRATHTVICVNAGGTTITCPSPPASTVQGMIYYVQVQVTGTVTSLLKYPGIPQQSTITSTAQMRVSNQ